MGTNAEDGIGLVEKKDRDRTSVLDRLPVLVENILDVLLTFSHPAALDLGHIHDEEVPAAGACNLVHGLRLTRTGRAVEQAGKTGPETLFTQFPANLIVPLRAHQILQLCNLPPFGLIVEELLRTDGIGRELPRSRDIHPLLVFLDPAEVGQHLILNLVLDAEIVLGVHSVFAHILNDFFRLKVQPLPLVRTAQPVEFIIGEIVVDIVQADAVVVQIVIAVGHHGIEEAFLAVNVPKILIPGFGDGCIRVHFHQRVQVHNRLI